MTDNIICMFCGKRIDIVQHDNVAIAFCNHCNKGTELDGYKQMAELWLAQANGFGTRPKGVEEIAQLETDPEVLRLVRILRDSESWEERSDAWLQIRKLGPGVKGWLSFEGAARDGKIGLWSEPNPIPPRDFRHKK